MTISVSFADTSNEESVYKLYTQWNPKPVSCQLDKYIVAVQSGSTLSMDALHWTIGECERIVGTARTGMICQDWHYLPRISSVSQLYRPTSNIFFS